MRGELTSAKRSRGRRSGLSSAPKAPPVPPADKLARELNKLGKLLLKTRVSSQLDAFLDDVASRHATGEPLDTAPLTEGRWPRLRFATKDEWSSDTAAIDMSLTPMRALNAALIARSLGNEAAYKRATGLMAENLRLRRPAQCGWLHKYAHGREARYNELLAFAEDSQMSDELPELLRNMGSTGSLWRTEQLTRSEQFALQVDALAELGPTRRSAADLEQLAAGLRKHMASYEPKAWNDGDPSMSAPLEPEAQAILNWMLRRAARGDRFDVETDAPVLFRALRNNGIPRMDRAKALRPLLLSTADAMRAGGDYAADHVREISRHGYEVTTLEGLRSRFEMAAAVRPSNYKKRLIYINVSDEIADELEQRLPADAWRHAHCDGNGARGVRVELEGNDTVLYVMRDPRSGSRPSRDEILNIAKIDSTNVFGEEGARPNPTSTLHIDDLAAPCRHPQAQWQPHAPGALALTSLCPECGFVLEMKARHLLDDEHPHAVSPDERESYLHRLGDRAALLDDRRPVPSSWQELEAARTEHGLREADEAARAMQDAAPGRPARPRLRA